VTDPAFLIADNNVANVLDFPLPFTSSSLTAQRIARIALNRNREQLTFSAAFGMRAFQVQVGDFVKITNERFGWDEKPFEIVEWTFGLTGDELDIQINMTLREISEGVFTDVDGSVFELNNTTLPSPFSGLAINNLSASGGGKTQGDGTFINSTILSWDAADNAFTSYYEVEWKPVADSNYSSTTTTETSIEISPVVDGVEYVYRVRAVTVLGTKGDFSSVQFTSGGDVTAPNPPTNVTAEAGYKYLTVKFDAPTAVDFNRVEVYESVDSNFGNASSIGFTSGNNFVRTGLGNNVTRYYWVRSQDFSGNSSAFVGPVNATTFLVAETDLTAELIATIEAAGVEPVNSLPASGDFDGQIVFLLTDSTLYRWDETGSTWSTELFTDIKDNSVTTDKLVASAVVASKIAAGAVTADKINVSELSAITANLGTIEVGSANIADTIQSDNYVSGTSGWNIRRDTGNAEFNDVTVRGLLSATVIDATEDFLFLTGNVGGADCFAPLGAFDYAASGISSANNASSITSALFLGPESTPTGYNDKRVARYGAASFLIEGEFNHYEAQGGTNLRLQVSVNGGAYTNIFTTNNLFNGQSFTGALEPVVTTYTTPSSFNNLRFRAYATRAGRSIIKVTLNNWL